MSRFFTEALKGLEVYTPGEQPRDMQYIKLNTNENPYPPAPGVMEVINAAAAERLRLYSDPTCKALVEAIAEQYGLAPDQVMAGNGSDEVLCFAVRAFSDERTPLVFPDITYGCYPIWAGLNRLPGKVIPLREDFTMDPADYYHAGGTVMLPNPNAPTGIALTRDEIEGILKSNPNNVVVIDEAYVDFGAESCVPLIDSYENLLVVQTFSKSRSLAGGRIGFAMGHRDLIADLNRIKFSFHPYNINSLSMAAGIAAVKDRPYFESCCQRIAATREETKKALRDLGFTVTDSKANFLFAKSDRIGGKELYLRLKAMGILVRYFGKERIEDYVRITVGRPEDMAALINAINTIFSEETDK